LPSRRGHTRFSRDWSSDVCSSDLARKVEEAGLIWVGPPPEAIEKMGDKITSRRTAAEAGVAAVPGITDPVSGIEEIEALVAEYEIGRASCRGRGGQEEEDASGAGI